MPKYVMENLSFDGKNRTKYHNAIWIVKGAFIYYHDDSMPIFTLEIYYITEYRSSSKSLSPPPLHQFIGIRKLSVAYSVFFLSARVVR